MISCSELIDNNHYVMIVYLSLGMPFCCAEYITAMVAFVWGLIVMFYWAFSVFKLENHVLIDLHPL